MKEEVKVSVIVPVYNSEKYLDKCIQSILNQTYTNFELLLINDGSKDDSGVICDKYAVQDARVRVFHQENGGVSSARNKGLDNATGEWICFVDSDDFLNESGFDRFFASKKYFSDIILFNTETYFDGTTTIRSNNKAFNNLEDYLFSNKIRHELWNYIFRRSKIQEYDIRFVNNMRIAEDRDFVIRYLSVISTMETNDVFFYKYREDNVSAMRSSRNKVDAVDHLLAIHNILEFYNKNRLNKLFIKRSIKSLLKITMSFSAVSNFDIKELRYIRNQYSRTINELKKSNFKFNIRFRPEFFLINVAYYKFRTK